MVVPDSESGLCGNAPHTGNDPFLGISLYYPQHLSKDLVFSSYHPFSECRCIRQLGKCKLVCMNAGSSMQISNASSIWSALIHWQPLCKCGAIKLVCTVCRDKACAKSAVLRIRYPA